MGKEFRADAKRLPHVSLVLATTRTSTNESTVELARNLIAQGVNWPEVMAFAIPHGVLPLMAHNLQKYAADLLPDAMLSHLCRYGKSVATRNKNCWLELNKITEALQTRGIRALGYKGPSLAIAAYGGLELREFHDLDIWVDPRETSRAAEVLRTLGFLPARYQNGQPFHFESPSRRATEFISVDGKTVVDLLDLRLSPHLGFSPPFEDLWERRISVAADGMAVASLCREDSLLALSVHGSKHIWRRLNWVVDVAGVVASLSTEEIGRALDRSIGWKCHRRVLTAMALASELYPAGPRLQMDERMFEGRHVQLSMRQSLDNLIEPDETKGLRQTIDVLRYRLREMDTLGDRVRLAGHGLSRRLNHLRSMMAKGIPFETDHMKTGRRTVDFP